MRAEEFLKYIKEPHLLKQENIQELQKLVHDFPYFQAGHLLLSLASKKWDASVYQQSLKKTAIVATNRNQLYKLIHELEEVKKENVAVTKEETITVEDNTKQELDILKSAEVVTEEIKEAEKEIVTEAIVKPEEKQEVKEIKKDAADEKAVELEIKKSLINSFVEKEILKTNEANKQESFAERPANFSDWLQFLRKNNGQSYSEIEIEVNKEKVKTAEKHKEKEKGVLKDKEKKKALIDKIIETNPGVIRQKEEPKFFKSDFKAKESLVENEHLVTETLAKIYALQGNINKAIRAYETLSLKFPQKSAYFASLIQKLKSNP
ncbi:MAG: hypothetical protein ACXVNQ_00870 [Bacteroidia bacterium]